MHDTSLTKTDRAGKRPFSRYHRACRHLDRAATYCLEASDAAAREDRAGAEYLMDRALYHQQLAHDDFRSQSTVSLLDRIRSLLGREK